MAARVQVIVEAKDASSGVLRAITGQFGALGAMMQELTAKNVSWGNVAEQAATLVVTGLKESIRATVEYAGEVRNLAAISGESTEETSRFIQVLDDYGLSADDALAATRALTNNGLAPNIETLAQLADQYNATNDAQAKNELIIKNLGRAGLQWVNVLKQGGAALRDQSAAVDESLILTERAVQQAREYEIAVDNWQDAVMGAKVAIGSALLPVMTDFINHTSDMNAAVELATASGQNWYALTQAQKDALIEEAAAQREAAAALRAGAQAAGDASKAAGGLNLDYTKLISTAGRLADANGKAMKEIAFATLQAKLSADGLTEAEERQLEAVGLATGVLTQGQIDAARALEILNAKLAAGTINAKQYAAALLNIPTTINTTITTTVSGPVSMCFIAGTLISMADGSYLPIEHVGHGDKVYALDLETGAKVAAAVEQTFEHPDTPGYLLINDLGVTPEHKILTSTGWKEAKDLVREDDIMTEGGFVPVESIRRVDGNFVTYNLHINHPSHNYFAGGVLVHNKEATQQGGEVFASQPRMVGERGAEPFIPASNGRILGHAESLAALQQAGGGGSFGPFYGNVTIEISEEGAGGIMGLR